MEIVIYTVQPGDTLYRIAQKYGTTVNMIARYNGIPDPDVIESGRLLRIPVSEIPKIKRQNLRRPTLDYLVKKGDTLDGIASMYGLETDRLASFNEISDPDVINEGDVLRIPLSFVPYPGTDNTTDTDPESVAGAKAEGNSYTVQEGDTLWKIAKAYGTTVSDLVNLNRLTCPDRLYPGQVLLLPDRS